jgi:dihydroflavonol-4-reductase
MNILVSGASGYIGSVLVPKLKELNYSVFGIDKVDPKIELKYFNEFVLDDLSVLHNNDFLKSEIDVLIHLAGESSINAKSKKQYKDNYIASKNLYMWCLDRKIRKIIMLSTIKVDKQGSYSETKKMSESFLVKICNQINTQYTILRSTPIYGVGMKGGLANWIERYKKVLIPDVRHSEAVFRLVGVNDLCAAIIFCLENTDVDNKIFEISDDNDYKIKEIDRLIKSIIGNNKKYIQLPRWLLWLASKLGDFINKIGLNTPFSTDRYRMLYINKPNNHYSFFRQLALAANENFMEQIPLIISNSKQ